MNPPGPGEPPWTLLQWHQHLQSFPPGPSRDRVAWAAVLAHRRLVHWAAKRWGHGTEDNVQDARLALYRAMHAWEPSRGGSIVTVLRWAYAMERRSHAQYCGMKIPSRLVDLRERMAWTSPQALSPLDLAEAARVEGVHLDPGTAERVLFSTRSPGTSTRLTRGRPHPGDWIDTSVDDGDTFGPDEAASEVLPRAERTWHLAQVLAWVHVVRGDEDRLIFAMFLGGATYEDIGQVLGNKTREWGRQRIARVLRDVRRADHDRAWARDRFDEAQEAGNPEP